MTAGCLLAATVSASDYVDTDHRDNVAIAEAVVRHEVETGALSGPAAQALYLSIGGRSLVAAVSPQLGDLPLQLSNDSRDCDWRLEFNIEQTAPGIASVSFFAGTCGDGPQGSMMYATVQRRRGSWQVTEEHAGISF